MMPNVPLRMGVDQHPHPAPMMIGLEEHVVHGEYKEQHQESRVSRSMSIGEAHGTWSTEVMQL